MVSPKIVIKWPLEPLHVATVNTILSTYEGRDKLMRAIQYGSRAVMGFTVGWGESQLNRWAREVMSYITGSRRSFRFGREIPILMDIPRTVALPDPIDRLLLIAQRFSILAFFGFDHLGWAKQVIGGAGWQGTVQTGV